MGKSYVKLNIYPETMKMIRQCIEDYLKHHPEMLHIKITQDKIVYEICRIYLKVR